MDSPLSLSSLDIDTIGMLDLYNDPLSTLKAVSSFPSQTLVDSIVQSTLVKAVASIQSRHYARLMPETSLNNSHIVVS